ncbi:uncharacterized protein [Neodiprion pinetum]|uniref:uncharacterized protein n=1 Tax=Neodiprion pinetum TaxID=441929 RepID=UPI001EDF3403|nr:uncharacterized protein LOC124215018 [Neodiprion pinetum]
MYLKHDPGESVRTIGENWSCDETPNPVPVDPWACGRMTVCKAQSTPSETKPCSVPCSSTVDVDPLILVPTFTGSSFETDSRQSSNAEELTRENRDLEPDAVADSERLLSSLGDGTSSASLSQGQRSIFTRTISMAKANLPVTRWKSQRGFKNETTNKNRGKKNKIPVAMQPPERLDLVKLPPDRLNTECVIVPQQGEKSQGKKGK